jgi:hypothetical protein
MWFSGGWERQCYDGPKETDRCSMKREPILLDACCEPGVVASVAIRSVKKNWRDSEKVLSLVRFERSTIKGRNRELPPCADGQ